MTAALCRGLTVAVRRRPPYNQPAAEEAEASSGNKDASARKGCTESNGKAIVSWCLRIVASIMMLSAMRHNNNDEAAQQQQRRRPPLSARRDGGGEE